MTNKEASNILKKCLSSEFKPEDLYTESQLMDAFKFACIALAKEKHDSTYGSLIRHTLRKTYRLILEDYVFGDYDINKLYCFLQPEIAEECKEEHAKALLRTAMENAYAALNNCDD